MQTTGDCGNLVMTKASNQHYRACTLFNAIGEEIIQTLLLYSSRQFSLCKQTRQCKWRNIILSLKIKMYYVQVQGATEAHG